MKAIPEFEEVTSANIIVSGDFSIIVVVNSDTVFSGPSDTIEPTGMTNFSIELYEKKKNRSIPHSKMLYFLYNSQQKGKD